MFQFSGLAFLSECYVFNIAGCPIRRFRDVILVCSSPGLIAAYHVLHRLSEPRHPPYALICFKKVYSVLVNYHKLIANSPLAMIIANHYYNYLYNYNFIFPICQRTYLPHP